MSIPNTYGIVITGGREKPRDELFYAYARQRRLRPYASHSIVGFWATDNLAEQWVTRVGRMSHKHVAEMMTKATAAIILPTHHDYILDDTRGYLKGYEFHRRAETADLIAQLAIEQQKDCFILEGTEPAGWFAELGLESTIRKADSE